MKSSVGVEMKVDWIKWRLIELSRDGDGDGGRELVEDDPPGALAVAVTLSSN